MSLCARSVCIPWVLMALLSMAKGIHIEVKNELGGNLDLNIYCPNFDPRQHIISPGNSYVWERDIDVPLFAGKPRFFCYFRWHGAYHTFDICTGHCFWVTWLINRAGPCRYLHSITPVPKPPPPPLVCYDWLS